MLGGEAAVDGGLVLGGEAVVGGGLAVVGGAAVEGGLGGGLLEEGELAGGAEVLSEARPSADGGGSVGAGD